MKNIFIVFFIVFSNSIYALNINEAFVLGEDINECNLSKEYSSAAIANVMRQNGISTQNSDAPFTFYHSINALKISPTACSVNINFKVQIYDYHLIPSKPPKKIFLTIPICSLGTNLSGPTYDLQSRVSEELRSMTERCIYEISKK